ncbi:MAG: hypothetical protein BWK80_36770 [Desulfobacteraceae bacterium IS3]|nr:MAG: hypothetical protein BWK80_36770 [Desulfobacteraceae bacterium IS3]
MNPIKTFIGTITNMPGLYLHILLTEEDDVIVARCLDFSVSSHGENKEEALASLNDSIADYLDYALKQGAFEAIIDPEEDMFWDIFKEQQLKEETAAIADYVNILKLKDIPEINYA